MLPSQVIDVVRRLRNEDPVSVSDLADATLELNRDSSLRIVVAREFKMDTMTLMEFIRASAQVQTQPA